MEDILIQSYRSLNVDTADPVPVLVEDLTTPRGWLTISSDDKSEYEPINNFKINKKDSYFSMNGVQRIAVSTVSFKWTIPNITPRNNIIQWTESGGPVLSVSIPEGFYNISDFASKLSLLMNAVSAGTIIISQQTEIRGYALDFTSTLPTVFIKAPTNKRDIPKMLNWKYDISSLNFFGAVPMLYYTRYISICSNSLNTYQKIRDEDSNGRVTDLLCRVYNETKDTELNITDPLNYLPNTVYFWNESFKWMAYVKSRQLSNIDIKLYDEFGDFLYTSELLGEPRFTLQFITEQ